jgi:glycosidase
MPDLNLTSASVASELQDTARSWLARGIDGFRLDAARYYVEGPQGESDTPQTHQWIRDFSSSLKVSFPDAILAGEVWSGLDTIAPYIRSGKELDLAFDFPFSGGLLDSLRNGTAAGFSGALRQAVELLPDARGLTALAPFLTNHDMGRIASQLSRRGDVDARLRLAALALLSQPGTPFLYYGEEIGMTNGGGPGVSTARGDVGKRTPMQWGRAGHHGFTPDSTRPWAPFSSDDPALSVQDQLGRKGSLLETYRQLIELRSRHPALGSQGGLQILPDPSPQCAAFIRSDGGGERILAVFNFGGVPAGPLSFGGLPGDGAELLWGSATIRRKPGSGSQLEVSGLPPGSGILVVL